MGKIRINDLARELEVKSKFILEHLPKINFLEKKSHSSSLEDEIADKVRAHFRALGEKEEEAQAAAKAPKAAKGRPQPSVLTPAKRAEKQVAPPPLRRSLEDIKADLRKKKVAVPPSSLRRIPGVTTRSPGTPARIASPPAAARPAAGRAGTILGKVSPVAAAPRVGAKISTAPVGGRKQPVKSAKKSKKADASKPLYQLAVRRTPGAVRPGAVRRPGEPHPVQATARGRPAPAGRHAPSPRPTGRRQAGQRRSALPPPKPVEPEVVPITRNITISEGISVKELSEKLDVRVRDVITKLLDRGVFATINQTLENSLATEISRACGAEVEIVTYEEEVQQEVQETEKPENLKPRAPVVTVMGHVDHGKTSLLDAIRDTNVTEGEAGGITQHIGAYRVQVRGRPVVFLDTPGHEAFTLMRARGAKVTDIVILVVAADDGVMPQTLEAIAHAKAAKVPLLVAINKIDKPNALPERVKKQLADRDLSPEEWGGETVMVEVSAKEKKNLDLLLEMVLLVADMRDVKANPDRPASGTVLEARLDRGRGPVATVLVQTGCLRTGDSFLAGAMFGRVRAMFDDHGRAIEEAEPSSPVEVLGLESVPQAGDVFQVIEDTAKAKQIALYRQGRLREAAMTKTARLSLEHLHDQLSSADVKELSLIIKADVQGSVEVLVDALNKCSTDRVEIKVLHSAVGAITQTDVLLASASNAIVIGFNVRSERKAADLAGKEKVDIRLHTVIYDLTDEIKKAMAGLLAVKTREVSLGRAEIRDTFRIRKVGNVAGSFVSEGNISRGARVRLLRDNVVIYEGKVLSLRRFKEDVEEVKSGLECGIILENFSDVKISDVLESFVVETVAEPALV